MTAELSEGRVKLITFSSVSSARLQRRRRACRRAILLLAQRSLVLQKPDSRSSFSRSLNFPTFRCVPTKKAPLALQRRFNDPSRLLNRIHESLQLLLSCCARGHGPHGGCRKSEVGSRGRIGSRTAPFQNRLTVEEGSVCLKLHVGS